VIEGARGRVSMGPWGMWTHTRPGGGGAGVGGLDGIGAHGDGLPHVSSIPWGTWTRPRPVGRGCQSGYCSTAWLRHTGLGCPASPWSLGGTWMRPNPIGDVSEGTDTSFDVGDTFGSRGEAPHRELWLGEVPAVSNGMGAVGPASDASGGMPRCVGTSSCVQDACGSRGDALRGGGSSWCPDDDSAALGPHLTCGSMCCMCPTCLACDRTCSTSMAAASMKGMMQVVVAASSWLVGVRGCTPSRLGGAGVL